MQDIDITAEKLKGNNCYIKFKDGEILFLKVDGLKDEGYITEWLAQTEDFINKRGDEFEYKNFQGPGIAVCANEIKYVRIL